jgi:uncharacterized protein YgbK (DUF1537 family)
VLPRASDTDAFRRHVRGTLEQQDIKLAVIDDDPTGTQTVRGVPLVTAWSERELEWAVRAATPTFAVLTNSRAQEERWAVEANREIGERLVRTANRLGVGLRVISRSDSTLRGHFPAESEALAEGMAAGGTPTDCIVLCPAYPEAGRLTVGNVHWVASGDRLIPVGETEFASDATFAYGASDLCDWVRERAGEHATVTSLTIDDIRCGGPSLVAERLIEVGTKVRYVVANAGASSDLDVLALGIELAESRGLRLIYRTGPSFVSARAGAETARPLAPGEVAMPGGRGLLVVGSHTQLSTAQLGRALARQPLAVVQLNVDDVVSGNPRRREAAVRTATRALRNALLTGDAAVVTTRRAVRLPVRNGSLLVSRTVADALVDVVGAVAATSPLDWMIAKGGITSHDMAVRALRSNRATVLGQLFPGKVSLWELGEGSLRPGLRYVVFAGNVGDEFALAATLERLKGQP